MTYKNELIRLTDLLVQREKYLRNELSNLPDGKLYVLQSGGKYYYYQRFPKGGNRKKERRYGISNDTETVLALVRKNYVEKALKNISEDIKLLEDTTKQFKTCDEDSLMRSYFERYPKLSEGAFYNMKNYKEWETSFKATERFYEEDLRSVSLKGVDMRSLGEIYITSRLDHFGIPHRYEAPLSIPDLGSYPDFTIIRPRDGKIIYWEHFGKVNDEIYVRNNIEKVTQYIEYGIMPWDNFIMTYNNKKGGFDAKLIDAMIECWLL